MMINKRLIGMVPETIKYMIWKVFVMWVSLLAGIYMWISVSDMLALFISNTLKESQIIKVAGIVILAILVRLLMTWTSSILSHKSVVSVKTTLRDKIYMKLSKLRMKHSEEFSTAEIVQLSTDGVEQLEVYFGNYLPQLAYSLLAPVTLFVVFARWSFATAIVLLVCVPLIPMSIIAVQKFAKKLLSKYWNSYASLSDVFLENLQGLTTLKVYSADKASNDKMNQDAEVFRKMTMKVLTMQLNSVTIMDFVAYGGTAAGTIICGFAFINGYITFGQGFVMVMLASEFFLAMRALGSFFHVAMNGMAASDKIFKLLDIEEEEQGVEDTKQGKISFERVDFAYDKENKVLKGVDFNIDEGKIVSIVGESGSGKSTISKIISSELRGYKGNVKIGDICLTELSSEAITDLITVVTASAYIFKGTVREHLLQGKNDATEEEMRTVLKLVNILDFIDSQEGLDTKIMERGSNLSGGQKQRLAMARALLKKSPIYIFDEATSNIDAESEDDIVKAIYSLKGKHTVIMISHRLENVVSSDEIFVMEKGQLKEKGNHMELLARGGVYANLYNAQKDLERLVQVSEKEMEETIEIERQEV